MSGQPRAGKRTRLLPILIGLGIVLVAGVWLWLSSTRSARPAGPSTASLVTTGYFFYLGRYIPPPYRVTVEGYRVLVNGEFPAVTMVEPPKPLPIPEDPGDFAWTPDKLKMPLGDVGLERHAGKKAVYWAFKHGPARAWEMVIEYIKAQPGVKEVRVMDENSVYVVGTSGGGFGYGVSPTGLKGWEESLKRSYASSEAEARRIHEKAVAERKQRLENLRAQYEGRFREGTALFVITPNGGVELLVGAHQARAFLAQLAAILKSGEPDGEKRKALMKLLDEGSLVDQLLANQGGPWPALGPEPPR